MLVATAVVLILAAVGIALATDSDPAPAVTAATGTTASPSAAAGPGPDPTTTAAPGTALPTAAAALAFTSVPLGERGAAATLTFGGVVLEQRAVGLTVTYPSLSVTTDGRQALAHVRLPTFNCLTPAPPADPLSAGCRRSLTEYADLATPGLRVGWDGDRLDVVGLFPTYIRPKGSPPAFTGRSYQLAATVTPEGAARNGQAPATGVLRIGMDGAASAPLAGLNLVQFAG